MLLRILVIGWVALLATWPGGSAAEESAADGAAAKKLSWEFPTGAQVELVAVVDLQSEPKVAWRANGEPCEVAKEWPEIMRVTEKATHGFVFRCQKFGPGQGIDFRQNPLGATPIPKESVPEFVTMSSVVFPTLKQGSIQVAQLGAWGPWQRFEVDGSRAKVEQPDGPNGKLYGLVEGVTLEHSPRFNLKVGVILRGFSGKWSMRELEPGQAEIVAHDLTGKVHEPRGGAVYEKSQIGFFSLPVESTDYYAYRLRPVLHWIKFDGIALKANGGTKVKVTVEESAQAKE